MNSPETNPSQPTPNLSRVEHSPDASIRQDGEGPKFISQQSISGERTKGWVTNVLLAISTIALVLVSIKLYTAEKDLQTQVWLRDDALTKFMTGPYAKLVADVQTNQALINAYGLQKSVCPQPERK